MISLLPTWKNWLDIILQEDPLEEEMATHSSIPPWKMSWTEEPGRTTVHGVMRVKDSRSTEYTQKLKPKLSFFVLEAHVFRQMCSHQYYRCILGGI